jgi:hypothetical protein
MTLCLNRADFDMPEGFDFAPVTEKSIWCVATAMCRDDAEEVWATGNNPMDALRESFAVSHVASVITYKDRPIYIAGLAILDDERAAPWQLRTEEALSHRKSMLRLGRQGIDQWLRVRPFLANICDARNTESMVWLKWLGFSFGEPVHYGPKNMPFIPFWLRANGCT